MSDDTLPRAARHGEADWPLADLRVIEFTPVVLEPSCGMVHADLDRIDTRTPLLPLTLGEHGVELLRGQGYDAATIAKLCADKVAGGVAAGSTS
jgi:crotonobetainyl-CoA:carnitine CoA-transferase CaiB-like acyl-CoA transferase